LSIKIYYDDVGTRIASWKAVRNLLEKVIADEKKIPGDLNFILTSDKEIRRINRTFLNHDYYTDVISFRYNTGKVIDGEVYISVDTVIENALNYRVSYRLEFLRVLIHGILHLCGYEDSTDMEKMKMREMEDYWISKYLEK
jgi:rRNA maturation RNase YbeY